MSLQSLDIRRRSASTSVPPGARGALEIAKLIDLSRCIGCKACQAACMEWNDLRDEVGVNGGFYTQPADLSDQSWTLMRFYEEQIDGRFQWLIVKDGCLHCADPGCLRACPAPGALVQYANGIVDFQEEYCIGCGYCSTGCPFNVPRFSRKDSKAYKCTLCSDRVSVGLEPACVKTCPTQALSFGSKEELKAQAEHRLVDLRERGFTGAAIYDPPGVGGTHVFFVLPHGDQPEVYRLPRDPRVSPVVSLWRGWSAKSLGVFTMFAVLVAGIFHYMKVGPVEVKEDSGNLLPRYSHPERLIHWGVAVAYVLLFISGLALFHPFFYWTSSLFGGGAFMRVLHPFLGVALAVLFFAYASRLWRDNLFLPGDREWLRRMFAYMNRKAETPVEGKYNAGQKLMFWSMILCIAALFATGLLIWRPYFAPAVPAGVRRMANVVHAFFAFVMFVGIGVHVYAAYWTKGSMQAMTRGTVTRAWARFHHPGWFRRMTGEEP